MERPHTLGRIQAVENVDLILKIVWGCIDQQHPQLGGACDGKTVWSVGRTLFCASVAGSW